MGTEIKRRCRQRGRLQRLVQMLHHAGDALFNPTEDSGSAKLRTGCGGFPASIYYRCFDGNSVHLRLAVIDLVRGQNKICKKLGHKHLHAVVGAPKCFCKTNAMMPRKRGCGTSSLAVIFVIA